MSPREHPSKEADPATVAPAVVGAAAPHHAEALGNSVADREKDVAGDESEEQPLHDSTSRSWPVSGIPRSPVGVS